MPVDYEALASFRHSLARFLSFSTQAARAVGLSPQQHQALLAIKGFAGQNEITMSELAERLQLRHNSVVELVDRLSTQGFVRRAHDQTDRRVVRLKLLAKGEKIIARLSETHQAELRQSGPELRARLAKVLQLQG